MALTPRLEMRQSQSLVMTPQLQQAIKLLQFSNVELTAYVEDELARNPLLESEDGASDGSSDGDEQAGETTADGEAETEGLQSIDFEGAQDIPSSETMDMDVDYDNLWNNDSPSDAGQSDDAQSNTGSSDAGHEGLSDTAFSEWGARGGGGFDPYETSLEQRMAGEETLRDHLIGQLNVELADQADRVIGLHLVDRLDEAGYLSGDLASVAELLGCSVERVEKTLMVLQHLDPPGVFARSLAECLALQLRELDRLDPAMQALLDNLELLGKHDINGLMRVCGVDHEDLVEMVAEVRALDPKPAMAFDSAVAQPITPDVIMRPLPGGGWSIDLNTEALPRLIVNNRYHARVSESARKKEDRHYIDECFQSANWLVKSLHQRATTILKVSTEIVRQQDGFFAHGVQALRPLVLKDIADAIEMHESTVSRVTSNKYIASPRGIFELKYFFTPAIASSKGGEAYSAESVRHRIRALIEAEPPKGVLSDDKIVDILTAEGMDIARRTVAKYRESMGIPSSVQRRRQKSSGL
ncbi:MAG: RNA polymerase factor sigma-54 [Rhodospirillales bacterium]|jgi:RNA polymerase sigma-54 factor|nr:RNA polymerase factor sigma-54 [Rhodospirillales bacterium]